MKIKQVKFVKLNFLKKLKVVEYLKTRSPEMNVCYIVFDKFCGRPIISGSLRIFC